VNVKYHTFVTHARPDVDELFVFWMLTRLRPDLCESDIKFQFSRPEVEAEGDILDAMSREKGFLLVGVGGGGLDEHSTLELEARNSDCAATLAAKEWGLEGKLELRQLLQFVLGNDRDALGSFGDVANVSRAMYRKHSDPLVAINHTLASFDALYHDGQEFAEAVNEIKRCGEKVRITSGEREIVVCVVRSDNERCNAASRWLKADILVQRQESGNMQIHTSKKSCLPSLDNVVRVLRALELCMGDRNIDKDWLAANWQRLGRDGNHEHVEEWYYFRRGQLVLNGSSKAHKPPTKLSLEDIKWALTLGLDTALSESAVQDMVLSRVV